MDAVNVCTNLDFSISPNGYGNIMEISANGQGVSNPTYNGNMPWGSTNEGCLRSGETNSTWMIINIASDGNLEMSFGAGGAQNGFYDWSIWLYNENSCEAIIGNTLAPVRCNYNSDTFGGTGLANTVPNGGQEGNYEPALGVECGEKYVICFSNWSDSESDVPIDFFGSAAVNCNPIIPYVVNINDINVSTDTICLGDTAELTPSGASDYNWLSSPFITNLVADTVLVSPNSVGNHDFYVAGISSCGADTALASITVLSPFDENCTNCLIDSITLDSTNCDYLNGNFELYGSLFFESPGDTGYLVVKNCSGDSSIYTSPFSSPLSYSIDSISADNTFNCNIEAYFTITPFCSIISENYAEPPCILYCDIDSISTNLSFCDSSDYTYDISGKLIFEDAPPVGQLIVRNICSEDSVVYNAPFESPFSYQIENIYGDGDVNCSVYAYFTDANSCYLYSNPFTERRCIPPCEITDLSFEFDSCGTNDLFYSGELRFDYPPGFGKLIIEDCHGVKDVFEYPFESPVKYKLDSIPADGEGCILTAYFTTDLSCGTELNFIPYKFPVPSFFWLPEEPTVFNTDVKVINESLNATIYEWELVDRGVINLLDTKDISYSFDLFESGEYPLCLRLTNRMGCEATLCDTIKVENPLHMYVPTGFKPFGINKEFKPIINGDILNYSDYSLKIFDRNGSVIFKTTDINQGWNGKINGDGPVCSLGVYVWKITVKEASENKPYKFMGNITLLR